MEEPAHLRRLEPEQRRAATFGIEQLSAHRPRACDPTTPATLRFDLRAPLEAVWE